MSGTAGPGTTRGEEIRRLRQQRPRNRFGRASAGVLGVMALLPWVSGRFSWGDLFSARRLANLERFLEEVRPYPLQGRPWDWGIALSWVGELLADRGWAATGITLAIATAAIALAAAVALALCLPAARSVATPEPYLPGPRPPSALARGLFHGVLHGTRTVLIFLRAIPEYVWAFLLITLVGPTAWPAVLALAFHNGGILGKLGAEVVENLPRAEPAALRGLGATRPQIAALGVLPAMVPRFLLFFFYRFETCVREATVLGMLGIVSLGFFIQDARARNHYDDMLFLVLLGSLLVLVGDLVSTLAREAIRRAK
jgi:phosphonate transport system permease protein